MGRKWISREARALQLEIKKADGMMIDLLPNVPIGLIVKYFYLFFFFFQNFERLNYL